MEIPGENGVRIETARLFESLLDWFPDMIQSVGKDGKIVYANRRASELLGRPREEIIGMHLRKLYAPEIWAKVEAGFATLQSRGNLTVGESLVLDRDGNRIPVEIRSFAVYDEDGHFLRTFSILRDIREHKSLQNQLLHSNRLAAIGELSACIAHDIANPLAVIRLYQDLMRGQTDDLLEKAPEATEALRESLTSLKKATDKIEKLTQHLRDLSRSREGQAAPVDLRDIIADALFMVENKLKRQDVRVDYELPASACMVEGNASQLEQVFMNLFSNACDAMRGKAEPVLCIGVRPAPEGVEECSIWECRVSDNGGGIPPDALPHIFQPFFTTKEKGDGTGLGLSIALQIVLRHNGLITAENAPGGGALFVLKLPAQAEAGGGRAAVAE